MTMVLASYLLHRQFHTELAKICNNSNELTVKSLLIIEKP
jgi:hypothetical protein